MKLTIVLLNLIFLLMACGTEGGITEVGNPTGKPGNSDTVAATSGLSTAVADSGAALLNSFGSTSSASGFVKKINDALGVAICVAKTHGSSGRWSGIENNVIAND